MAKNHKPEKPVEPESESGEEEEEEEEEASSEEEESEPEPEQQNPQAPKKPSSSSTPASLKKPQPEPQPESSDDEEDSGSESDSEPDPKIKPLASKPMSEASGKQPRSKDFSSEPAAPVKSTATKRPAEDEATEANNNKKLKKKVDDSDKKPNNDDSKKQLFQRLWSEGDEIEVLKGMIDYAAKKKLDPVVNLSAFHDFIRKNLHVDVTRTQLQDKIRRLKKKYMNNKKKEKEGKDRTFTNPHEQKGYELSKKIWGNESGVEKTSVASPKTNGTGVKKTVSKKANVDENEGKDVEGSVGFDRGENVVVALAGLEMRGASVEERVLAIGLELFERGKEIEGEEEWNRLRNEEMEIYMRQVEIKRVQTKLVMDAMKHVER